MGETVVRGVDGSRSTHAERPAAGSLYALLRALYVLERPGGTRRAGEPLYGQQTRPCRLRSRRGGSRAHTQRSSCHGAIIAPRER